MYEDSSENKDDIPGNVDPHTLVHPPSGVSDKILKLETRGLIQFLKNNNYFTLSRYVCY